MSASPSVDNALMSHFSSVYTTTSSSAAGNDVLAGMGMSMVTDDVGAASDPASRVQSPRPETPEPYVAQGRRNAPVGVQLLDAKGVISEKFQRCLGHIFAKYCTPSPISPKVSTGSPVTASAPGSSSPTNTSESIWTSNNNSLLTPPPDAYLTAAAFDQWARDTNGSVLPPEVNEELEQLDLTENGNLTFRGFLQIYQSQTENDEEESWRDLSTHGFDRTLTLVTTRREDMEDGPESRSRESTPQP